MIVVFDFIRLYKTLGNFDVLRGIFSGHIGTKDVTKLALEAEERSDYHTAQQLYKEVNDNSLMCYSHLTNRHWGEMIGQM